MCTAFCVYCVCHTVMLCVLFCVHCMWLHCVLCVVLCVECSLCVVCYTVCAALFVLYCIVCGICICVFVSHCAQPGAGRGGERCVRRTVEGWTHYMTSKENPCPSLVDAETPDPVSPAMRPQEHFVAQLPTQGCC